MIRILITILTLFIGLNLFAQEEAKVETIPLEREIEIEITSIDSTSLGLYQVYEFTYLRDKKEVQARFWAEKKDDTFELGNVKIKLCRIIQMKSEDGLNIRGCAFYNGFSISENDSIVVHFDFDEYGENPTLRLCSTN